MDGEFWEKYRDRRWQEKRLRIMERAGFRCEMCGSEDSKETLHIHHGYYRSKADLWDYPDDTLWCLCESCHEAAEANKQDCHSALATINPAFLELAATAIESLRDGLFLIDDEGITNKRSIVAESDTYADALIAIIGLCNPKRIREILGQCPGWQEVNS
jgi:hypothetical protein